MHSNPSRRIMPCIRLAQMPPNLQVGCATRCLCPASCRMSPGRAFLPPMPLSCSEVPAIAAVLAALAAFNAQLQPLRDAWASFKRWEEALVEE